MESGRKTEQDRLIKQSNNSLFQCVKNCAKKLKNNNFQGFRGLSCTVFLADSKSGLIFFLSQLGTSLEPSKIFRGPKNRPFGSRSTHANRARKKVRPDLESGRKAASDRLMKHSNMSFLRKFFSAFFIPKACAGWHMCRLAHRLLGGDWRGLERPRLVGWGSKGPILNVQHPLKLYL